MMLPPGWEIFDTTEGTERTLLSRARQRLVEAGQLGSYPALAERVKASLAAARGQKAELMIMPTDNGPAWAMVPISILVTVREGTPAATLDQIVTDVIERRGGRALDSSKHFIRWVDRRRVPIGDEEVGAYTVVYLTPIVGSQRKKGLQFSATLVHDPAVDPEQDDDISPWLAALDAHMATFAWTGR
ncbi:hypothetical protein DY023_04910 [Microbacterium bovistercoris]|uniref:Lipoprotein LpqN n=2 Tax=Microbacterium bovistercoris TaxID=2293570 RepID=A0A371NVY6_9MICO|nr:hypothetical protein DY023_04910 [Microbacterium bovistercoris]